jgi:sensor domain CHASE-containing protein
VTLVRAFFVFLLTIHCAYASLAQTRTREAGPVSDFFRNVEQAITARSCKAITDIDHTVVSSGGHTFCGIMIGDFVNQFKHGEFYRGVTQFGLELARAKQVLPKLLFRARIF